MSEFLKEALDKLEAGEAACNSGGAIGAMKGAVHNALKSFCEQDGEFAQAVAQGGSFPDCMAAVAKNVGGSISDLDAYKRAAAFFFPGADIRFQMYIELCPTGAVSESAPAPKTGLMVDIDSFF